MKAILYRADIGPAPNGRFGWACADPDTAAIERHCGGNEIVDLVDAVAENLSGGRSVALGFGARCSSRCLSTRCARGHASPWPLLWGT